MVIYTLLKNPISDTGNFPAGHLSIVSHCVTAQSRENCPGIKMYISFKLKFPSLTKAQSVCMVCKIF